MEVMDPERLVVFFTKCPLCNKYFISLSKYQLVMNMIQHSKKHKDGFKIEDLVIKYVVMDLTKEDE